jgi:hypothetical protein
LDPFAGEQLLNLDGQTVAHVGEGVSIQRKEKRVDSAIRGNGGHYFVFDRVFDGICASVLLAQGARRPRVQARIDIHRAGIVVTIAIAVAVAVAIAIAIAIAIALAIAVSADAYRRRVIITARHHR